MSDDTAQGTAVNDMATRRFAITVTLHERLGAPDFPNADRRRGEAVHMSMEFPVEVFTFPDTESALRSSSKYGQALMDMGSELMPEPVSVDGEPCALMMLKEPNFEVHKEQEDSETIAYLMQEPFVLADQATVKEVSRIIGLKTVFCLSEGIVMSPRPETPDTVYFFQHARPPGLFKFGVDVRKMFGMYVWKNEGSRKVNTPTRGRGRVVYATGMPIFQVIGSNYYQVCLTHDTDSHPINRLVIFQKVMGTFIRDFALRSYGEIAEPEEPSDAQYAEFVAERLRIQLSVLDDKRKEHESEINRLQGKLAEELSKRQACITLHRALQESTERQELRERLPGELEAIKAIEGVTSVGIVEDGLHLFTEPLVIEHEGVRYPLGVFTVRLDPEHNRVEVWNDSPLHPKGHHHPHIDHTSLTCFGNVTTALGKCMSLYRYADAALIAMRWLRTYNPDNTLIPIEEWEPEGGAEAVESKKEEADDARAED